MPPLSMVLVFFIKIYGLLGNNIVQPDAEVRAQLGDTVTLPCFHPAKEDVFVTYVGWFKQPLRQKPQLVAIISKYNLDSPFSNEFKNSERFKVKVAEKSFNLTVSQVEPSDSATYYCAVVQFLETSFGDGTTLIVTDWGVQKALNNSGENGTKQDFEGNEVLLSCLAGALGVLTLSVILNIVLALKRRKGSEDDKGAASISEVPREDLTSKQCQDEAMNYAALTFTTKKHKVRRKKREVEKETVYSDMRFRDRE